MILDKNSGAIAGRCPSAIPPPLVSAVAVCVLSSDGDLVAPCVDTRLLVTLPPPTVDEPSTTPRSSVFSSRGSIALVSDET